MLYLVLLLATFKYTNSSSNDSNVLLKLKSHVNDPLMTLESWNSSRSVCKWEGIVCSNHNQVINLHLQFVFNLTSALITSVVQDIPHLQELHVRRSSFTDTIDKLSLQNCSLEVFDLSDNQIHGTIPFQLFNQCKFMKVFNVSYNQLIEEFPSGKDLIGEELQILDLSHNNLTGVVSRSMFSTCTSLHYLSFSYNNLLGEFPFEIITNCLSLKVIVLAHNKFHGAFPPLKDNSIEKLDISFNSFSSMEIHTGTICNHLTRLEASFNMLSGRVFHIESEHGVCNSLKMINISSNSFIGPFFSTLVGKTNGIFLSLEVIDASFNNFTGEMPEIHKNLKHLDLSSNTFNSIQSRVCSPGSKLKILILPNNKISGQVLQRVLDCTSLEMLDLSFNSVSGGIPKVLCERLPNLQYLLAWGNSLTGPLPASLAKCRNLSTISLSYNNLEGRIPIELSQLKELWWLDLSSNRFFGTIPSSFADLHNMTVLYLSNNSLDGDIPGTLANSKKLTVLALNSNSLTGTIPSRIGRTRPGLEYLNMRTDDFSSLRIVQAPVSNCKGMPSGFYVQGMRLEDLRRLLEVRSGCTIPSLQYEPLYAFEVSSLVFLDLSYNKLVGEIPAEIGEMQSLLSLSLSHNALNGTIPGALSEVKKISIIDLSGNALQGSIPYSLTGLSFLRVFNVSYNNLSGPIPQSGQMTTFTYSSYEGNAGLCGLPLLKCADNSPVQGIPGSDGDPDYAFGFFMAALVAGIISFFVFVMLILLWDKLSYYALKLLK